jgi:glycosyltransferase involved in cell wall biosynthesis
MKLNQTVSVVIVTHNRLVFLKRCLFSILNNSTTPKEIIIVDDGDKDKAARRISEQFRSDFSQHKTKVVYKRIYPPKGVSYSRNIGLKNSTGTLVAFIDDDCIASTNWIKNIVISHQKYKSFPAITGYVAPLHPNNYWNRVLYFFHSIKPFETRETNFLFGANYSFKKIVLDRENTYFNEKMKICSEDRYISFKLMQRGYKLLYDHSIRVKHEFRTNLKDTFAQWLRYGRSDYHFWRLNPDFQENPDATYFRDEPNIIKIIIAPARSFNRIMKFFDDLEVSLRNVYLIPGLIFIFSTYFLGIYLEWTKYFALRN